jgi:hypothetical protein
MPREKEKSFPVDKKGQLVEKNGKSPIYRR